MALDLSRLTAAAQKQTTVNASILKFIADTGALLKDLAAQLKAAIDANDPAAQAAIQKEIDDTADKISAGDDEILAKINENTPAAGSNT